MLVMDTKVHPDTYVRTDAVHCQICGSKKDARLMLLCNKGFHTFCLDQPLQAVRLLAV